MVQSPTSQPGLDVGHLGTPALAATSAAAMVEFTSPTTTTTSGRNSARIGSNPDHHRSRLLGVGAGPDVEMVVGRADAELVEKHLAHGRVVVLAGMDQDDVDRPPASRASMTGLIFMKLGRAPATQMTRIGRQPYKGSAVPQEVTATIAQDAEAALLAFGLTLALCPPVLAGLRRWGVSTCPGPLVPPPPHPAWWRRGPGPRRLCGAGAATSACQPDARTGLVAACRPSGSSAWSRMLVGVPALRRLASRSAAGALATLFLPAGMVRTRRLGSHGLSLSRCGSSAT